MRCRGMSDVAARPDIQKNYPLIADTLKLAASPQLRNRASLGGNVLQRTRCSYFRDVSYQNCNKRKPRVRLRRARRIFNRFLVRCWAQVTSVSRPIIRRFRPRRCWRSMPRSRFTARIGASVTCPFAELHKPPGNTPQIETALSPGELISAFSIPGRWPRSVYLKARDRQSYEFALASVAIALDVRDGVINDARIALGGVATVPWRARAGAEALLKGQKFDDALAASAADAAFADAKANKHNAFKIALGKRVVARALHQAATMEI